MLDLTHVFADFPTLETKRCILRAIRASDAPDILALLGDEQVTRYLGRYPITTLQEAHERIQRYTNTYDNQGGLVWMIVHRDTQKAIGNCLVWNLIPEHHRAELGYMLKPAYWRKGIMSEVIPVILNYAFTTMSLHSLAAQIDPENEGSRRLLEKFGFVQEAYFREDFYHPVYERFTDTVVLSLLQSEWRATHK